MKNYSSLLKRYVGERNAIVCVYTIRKSYLLFDQSFDLSNERKKQLQDKVVMLEKPTMALTCRGKTIMP
jgi:hypothetical protein